MKRILLSLISIYQREISPFLPASCRYQPTCSQYTRESIERFGAKGLLMGLARILRCHPWAKGGNDPVPDHFALKGGSTSGKF